MRPALDDIYLLENLLLLKKRHNLTTFFETGTYHGLTTRKAAHYFTAVETVESNKNFYDIAVTNLADITNVKIYKGSSPDVMREVLSQNQLGLVFFLDAHWEDDWPLLEELRVMAEKNIKPVILIHDFLVPDDQGNAKFGFDSYKAQPLDFNFVKSKLDLIYGEDGYTYFYSDKVEINSGVLYVEPKQ
jgi:hypothetical protein